MHETHGNECVIARESTKCKLQGARSTHQHAANRVQVGEKRLQFLFFGLRAPLAPGRWHRATGCHNMGEF